jgi:hypothetical protein
MLRINKLITRLGGVCLLCETDEDGEAILINEPRTRHLKTKEPSKVRVTQVHSVCAHAFMVDVMTARRYMPLDSDRLPDSTINNLPMPEVLKACAKMIRRVY